MGKFRKLLLLICCAFLLGGCNAKEEPLRLVTKISITDQSGFTRHYTQPQALETILYYLRSLKTLGVPNTDPERIMGEHYQIRLEYSDGQTSIYRQRANRFLSKDSHPWQNVSPQRAALLGPLLQGLDQGLAVTDT